MPKLHLDSDIGGDMDDLCALAMLLRWPEVTLTRVTTSAEAGGRRAGYVRYVLELEGRLDIPFAAGADASYDLRYRWIPGYPPDELLWPDPVAAHETPVEEALALLKASVDAGAVVAAIGPFTNLRLLEECNPGILGQTSLVLMGGYPFPPRAGFPAWGSDYNYNVQTDVLSSRIALTNARPLLVPVSITVETALRGSYLEPLRESGRLGGLLAYQAEHWLDVMPENRELARTYPRLPEDFMTFQHDPLACAVAAGWDGVVIEDTPLAQREQDGWLVEKRDPAEVPMRVVTALQGERFNAFWLDCITRQR